MVRGKGLVAIISSHINRLNEDLNKDPSQCQPYNSESLVIGVKVRVKKRVRVKGNVDQSQGLGRYGLRDRV
jgi:hypothetical protein